MNAALHYDRRLDRFCIGDFDLHCGDVFEIKIKGRWQTVRIEMNHDGRFRWYLIYDDLILLNFRGKEARRIRSCF